MRGLPINNMDVINWGKTMNTEMVSIIVPVYNERRYLKGCINSILNQTYKNIEIILVDDGSTDGTSDDCDRLSKMDRRIIVCHKENSGYSDTIYEGIIRSQGDWIMFSDDDDIWHKSLVETLMGCRNDDVDIVAGGRIDSTNPDSALKEIDAQNGEISSFIDTGRSICEMIPQDKQKYVITPLWGKIYRASFLKSLNLKKYASIIPTNYLEDVFATPLLYCKANTICIVKRPLYIHREVSTSLSRSGKLNNFYYDQIAGGDILLQYFKNNKMSSMYNYELVIFFRTILRIRCLDDDKRRGDLIHHYFNIYKKDYYRCKGVSFVEHISARIYDSFPKLWRTIARKYYYMRKKS